MHRWRAEAGIELIHEEPTLEEFQRIRQNWELMTPKQKAISDIKSKELFGVDNQTHYNMLMKKSAAYAIGVKLALQDLQLPTT